MSHETWKASNPKDVVGSRKPRWFSYLPLRALVGVGLACLEGALKYGRHNYREVGIRASVYVDAAVNGHLAPWWEGQDTDPDSGLNHIDKAIASLLVLRDGMLEGNWVDDRPPAAKGLTELLAQAEKDACRIIDKYPTPVPAFTEVRRRAGEHKPPIRPEHLWPTVPPLEPARVVVAAGPSGITFGVAAQPEKPGPVLDEPVMAAEAHQVIDHGEVYRVAATPNHWHSAALKQVGEFVRAFDVEVAPPGELPSFRARDLAHKLIEEEVKELADASVFAAETDRVKTLDALLDIQYTVLHAAYVYGFQDIWDVAFSEVHRSNMSKLDTDGKPLRRADGKVVKGPLYSPPDLERILAETAR